MTLGSEINLARLLTNVLTIISFVITVLLGVECLQAVGVQNENELFTLLEAAVLSCLKGAHDMPPIALEDKHFQPN